MPTGVRIPVASMSIRALIGMVQALVTPGSRTAESMAATSRSYVMPGRHSASGLSVIVVSNMSSPAGSVAVVGPARLAPDVVHLGETLEDAVLDPEDLPRPGDADARAASSA